MSYENFIFFGDFNAGIEHSVLKDLQFVSSY